jgi:hypothetical protein
MAMQGRKLLGWVDSDCPAGINAVIELACHQRREDDMLAKNPCESRVASTVNGRAPGLLFTVDLQVTVQVTNGTGFTCRFTVDLQVTVQVTNGTGFTCTVHGKRQCVWEAGVASLRLASTSA